MSNTDLHPEVFFMIFGSIWDAFGEPLGSFVGSKMLRKIMFFLNAFCMLSGSRAGGTQAGSTGGSGWQLEGNWAPGEDTGGGS